MREYLTFYIGGQWVEPATAQTIDVINPAIKATMTDMQVTDPKATAGTVEAGK